MLTDRLLKSIHGKEYDGKQFLSDKEGLSVRITSKGTIRFVYQYRLDSKVSQYALGRYPDITLKEARDMLPTFRGFIRKGMHVKDGLASSPSENRITLQLLAEEWIVWVERSLKDKTVTLYRSTKRAWFDKMFVGRDVYQIRPDEWISFFDQIAEESPQNASAVLRKLKAMLRWHIDRQRITHLRVLDIPPSAVGKAPNVGERHLTYHELAMIWREIELSKVSPSNRIIFKLMILTGCRVGEALTVEWADLDLESLIWTIPPAKSKTNKAIRRPITPQMLELFKQMETMFGRVRHYVFFSPNGDDKPLSYTAINRFSRRIRAKLAGRVDNWRTHDFRHSLVTRLSENGVQPHVTEKMLGHELQGIIAVYNKHDWLDEQRKGYVLHHDLLMKMLVG